MLDLVRQFRFLPDQAFVGTWKWEPDRGLFYTDEGLSRFFDVPYEAALKGLPTTEFTRHLHPDDRARVSPRFRSAAERGLPFSESYRVMTRHNSFRHVRSYGRPLGAPDGERQYVGAIIDIGQIPDDRGALIVAIDHLMMARESLKTQPPSMLERLIEAVLLEAGHELAKQRTDDRGGH
ncbi:PAS domain-containing protein [Aureimonas ureilytica]|uniref:PAS domain-containing protein n=1 Tax=Aureimonas ureilytica TaxID=401562 RepID=UPI003CF41FC5